MSDGQTVFVRIGRIVAAAGVAAGAAAGLASLVTSGKRSSGSRITQPRATELPALESAQDQLRKVTSGDAAKSVRESLQDVAESTGLQGKKLGMNKFSSKDASKLVDQVRDSAVEGKGRFGQFSSDSIHDAVERISNAAEEGRDARDWAQESLEHTRAAAKDRRRWARQQSGERLSDLERYVTGTVESKVKPSLAKAGESAGNVAGDLRSRLSTELDRLGDVADQRRPQISTAANQVSARISHLLKEVDASGDEWRETADNALHDAERVFQDNANAARRKAGTVGDSAKQGGKSLASLLFWVAVAAGLVYAVLMDEDQKRKSRELAAATWHESRELYRDIRGRDADFEN